MRQDMNKMNSNIMSERRIRNNRIRRQRQLRRNLVILFFSFILVVSLSLGCFAFGSKAQNNDDIILYKYYTSIEIQYGESIEDIAERYFCCEKYDSMNSYIEEVMYTNGMYTSDITAGSYLVVPYYSSVYK